MVDLDDIAGAVKTRLAAVSGSSTTLPGLSWLDRGPDAPAGYPYCVFKVEAGDSRLSTGDLYSQTWTVRLAAYCPIGASGVTIQNVQQLFHNALVSTAANTALLALSLRNTDDKIIAGRPRPGPGQYAQQLREGRDVFVCGLTAELVVQGTRGTA